MAEIPVGFRRIEGSERRPAPGAQRLSPADQQEKLFATIRVRRRPGAPPAPDQSYWAAIPPGRRQFITRDELVAQSGATQADLDQVEAFARAYGFEVLETSAARRTVRVSGTVEQANRAFAVDLGRYQSSQEAYRGREGPVYVPNEVADLIEGVFGLDNRRMARRAGTVVPPDTVTTTVPIVAGLYNFPPLKASGQTIGILEFGGGFAQSDLDLYWTTLKLPGKAPIVTIVSVDGASSTQTGNAGSPSNSDFEVALDVQVAASVAQGANIVMFFAPSSTDGWVDAVTTAIYEFPGITALSTSWGASEDTFWDSNTMNALDLAFQDASNLGISIFAATGDYGSNNQDNDGNPHVQYPASDPWVTACGGTFIGTLVSPFTEGTWNDWAIVSGKQQGGATGGGVSGGGLTTPTPPSAGGTGFPPPQWQAGLKVTTVSAGGVKGSPVALTGRGVPDVAGNASPFSGYELVLYGKPAFAGGTSAVAPLYAALIAIIAAKAGWPLGFLNPILYEIGAAKGPAFVDISDGVSNELNVSYALPGGSAPPTPCTSYATTSGWDAVTGWGRINGNDLLTALIPLEETRSFNGNFPFSFGAGGEWTYHNDGTGSQSSGDSINAGQSNTANIYDTTILTNNSPNNAVLMVINSSADNGAVGLYGQSDGSTWSIGAAGVAPTGCGVYGIANIGVPDGIGVAGRALGGLATEYLPLEKVVGEPVGVLGHSANGPGVRGHGGILLKQPEAGLTLPATPSAPGGAFSSGRLQDQLISGAPVKQTVSLDPVAQLRLVPSTVPTLPKTGVNVGDLFLVYVPGQVGNAPGGAAQLWLCTYFLRGVPQWQQVPLGIAQAGGSSV